MNRTEKLEAFKLKGFTYDQITGDIYYPSGKIAKALNRGYIYLNCVPNGNPINILGHHLAWYLYYNQVPPDQIDHIDGDKKNNIISNLRLATNQQNMFNLKNVKGYTWNKLNKNYNAQIMVNGKHLHLGVFDNEQDARNAYLEAKIIYHNTN